MNAGLAVGAGTAAILLGVLGFWISAVASKAADAVSKDAIAHLRTQLEEEIATAKDTFDDRLDEIGITAIEGAKKRAEAAALSAEEAQRNAEAALAAIDTPRAMVSASGSIELTPTSWMDVPRVSVQIDGRDNPILLVASGADEGPSAISAGATISAGSVALRITRDDGVVVAESELRVLGAVGLDDSTALITGNFNLPPTLAAVDLDPGTNPRDYRLQFSVKEGGGSMRNVRLIAIEIPSQGAMNR